MNNSSFEFLTIDKELNVLSKGKIYTYDLRQIWISADTRDRLKQLAKAMNKKSEGRVTMGSIAEKAINLFIDQIIEDHE